MRSTQCATRRHQCAKSKFRLSKAVTGRFVRGGAIMVSAFRRKREAAYLSNFLRRNRTAWEWALPSSARLLKRTAAALKQKTPRVKVHGSILLCRSALLPNE